MTKARKSSADGFISLAKLKKVVRASGVEIRKEFDLRYKNSWLFLSGADVQPVLKKKYQPKEDVVASNQPQQHEEVEVTPSKDTPKRLDYNREVTDIFKKYTGFKAWSVFAHLKYAS